MLDARQYEDLREIFPTLVLFGDPAQLAPVGGDQRGMVFDGLPARSKLTLERVHRQAEDNPILDLAHALGDPALDFETFERMVEAAATRDEGASRSGDGSMPASRRARPCCAGGTRRGGG